MDNEFTKTDLDEEYVLYCKMPDMNEPGKENELSFKNWISQQKSTKGVLFSSNTIGKYISALRNVASKIPVPGHADMVSVFELTDMSDFLDAKNKIKSSADYDAIDKYFGNGSLNAGLDWYEKFLKIDVSAFSFSVVVRRFMFGASSRITVPMNKYEQVKSALGVTEAELCETGGYPLKLLIDGIAVDGSCYIKKNSETNVTIRYSTEQQNKLKEIFAYSYDMTLWNPEDKNEYESMEVEIVDKKTINFKCFPILPQIDSLIGNKETFEKVSLEYIKDFKELLWKDGAEKYKWNHLVWFKEHWDIDAVNFPEMLKEALKLSENLLDAGQSHLPLTGILRIADKEPETAREMFKKLYDENIDLGERIQSFMDMADTCYAKYYNNSHDQNTNAISVYLWSRYPEKYYIYKYKEIKVVAKMLGSSYKPTKSSKLLLDSCVDGFGFYDAINYYVRKNDDLQNLLKKALQESDMPDDADKMLHTLTIDIGYYMANYMWWPREKEYTPKLDEKAWRKLLLDDSVFDDSALKIIKRMDASGGAASCIELSLQYGLDTNFYNKNSTELAKRICDKTGCKPFLTKDKNEQEVVKHWPVIYVGRSAGSTEEGSYIWKLRDELSSAMEDKDVLQRLEGIELYEDGFPKIIPGLRMWRISHGNDVFGEERSAIFERNAAVLHTECTGRVNGSKIKGKDGMALFKPGDFVYVAFSNDVRVLGVIKDAKWNPCPEKNQGKDEPEWFEIKYEVVANSIKNRYTGTCKAWAPNYHGGTFALVKDDEQRLFEKEMLIPHFGKTLEELKEYSKEFVINPPEDEPIADFNFDSINYERNTIVFGAPGTGKSYCLEEELKELFKSYPDATQYYERVTFHPEYNYFKFVGSYRPIEVERDSKKEITYSFVPGPFVNVLIKALNNPKMPFILLIEEINRANVAAVFGDVFQLLDRDDDGNSCYRVNVSKELQAYLKEHITTGASINPIGIPSNMYIWATMNSADQGVFPMDTAFKRRWEFEYIGIDDEMGSIPENTFEIAGVSYKWNDIRRAINDVLSAQNINEDKLMGPFFLAKKLLEDKGPDKDAKFIKAFKSKVLMYLFEDAAKQKRKEIFGPNAKRYSFICNEFNTKGIECFGDAVISSYKEYDKNFIPLAERNVQDTENNQEPK